MGIQKARTDSPFASPRALYLDDRHRPVDAVILTVGWVRVARLSARPILFSAQT